MCDTSDLRDSLREKAWTACLAVRTCFCSVDIAGLGSESVVMTSCDSLSVMRGPKRNANICPSDRENAKKIGKFTHTRTDTLQHKRNL